ncbi:hypothetical protein CYMTET_52954 [Cymbomonas tetramitiformis]|uniref:Uncharacterized protein n=1 Tax=Cymbomonas tetramitiformis TaxID=36881 RepID=A0AAE0BHX9_9CHLO|nr:hypothetical protein CYMTET_52954 [Cymbomonas tetramitiformis]
MNPEHTAEVFKSMSIKNAKVLLRACPKDLPSTLLGAADANTAAAVLRIIPEKEALELMKNGTVPYMKAAHIYAVMSHGQSAIILGQLDAKEATSILAEMEPQLAGQIMQGMAAALAADLLTLVMIQHTGTDIGTGKSQDKLLRTLHEARAEVPHGYEILKAMEFIAAKAVVAHLRPEAVIFMLSSMSPQEMAVHILGMPSHDARMVEKRVPKQMRRSFLQHRSLLMAQQLEAANAQSTLHRVMKLNEVEGHLNELMDLLGPALRIIRKTPECSDASLCSILRCFLLTADHIHMAKLIDGPPLFSLKQDAGSFFKAAKKLLIFSGKASLFEKLKVEREIATGKAVPWALRQAFAASFVDLVDNMSEATVVASPEPFRVLYLWVLLILTTFVMKEDIQDITQELQAQEPESPNDAVVKRPVRNSSASDAESEHTDTTEVKLEYRVDFVLSHIGQAKENASGAASAVGHTARAPVPPPAVRDSGKLKLNGIVRLPASHGT